MHEVGRQSLGMMRHPSDENQGLLREVSDFLEEILHQYHLKQNNLQFPSEMLTSIEVAGAAFTAAWTSSMKGLFPRKQRMQRKQPRGSWPKKLFHSQQTAEIWKINWEGQSRYRGIGSGTRCRRWSRRTAPSPGHRHMSPEEGGWHCAASGSLKYVFRTDRPGGLLIRMVSWVRRVVM